MEVVARLILSVLGWLLALLPRPLLQLLCHFLGAIFYYGMGKRRRIMVANLRHVFPKIKTAKLRKIARISGSRLVEMALFSLASPHFSRRRIRRNFSIGAGWESVLGRLTAKESQLLLIPHQTLTEALTFLPLLLGLPLEELPVAILYRPFSNEALENFIKKTREKFGIQLLSRRDGLHGIVAALRRGGCVGMLFDQRVRTAGAQTIFCGRVVQTTPLPEILRKHVPVAAAVVEVRRSGFWRAELRAEPLRCDEGETLFAMNRWLEERLVGDGQFCLDWLWSHNRWKREESQLLNLFSRKDLLQKNLRYLGLSSLPKKFQLWVHLPEDDDQLEEAIPLVRAICAGRSDAFVSVFCRKEQLLKAESCSIANAVFIVPREWFSVIPFFNKHAATPPDLHLLFNESLTADFGALCAGAPLRIGFGGNRLRRWLFSIRRQEMQNFPESSPRLQWERALEKFGFLEKK